MRPLMKDAIAAEASLMAEASLEMVSFCMSSSSTLMLWAFSEEGMLADVMMSIRRKRCESSRVSKTRSLGRDREQSVLSESIRAYYGRGGR